VSQQLSFGITFSLALGSLLAQQPPAQSPFLPISEAVSDKLIFQRQLPDFVADDLAGHTWRSADLNGKVTYVSIWSTWCVPCRKELPALQHFYEETKSGKSIQILTFSLDQNASQARSFMNASRFTFPVIVDWNPEKKLFPQVGGIPQSWVIDRQGKLSEPFQAWTSGRVFLEVEKLAYAN